MVFTDPGKAFEVLKEVQSRSSLPARKEAVMVFRGVWVFAQGAGGPAKMLPNVSQTSPYSWTASEFSKLQSLISWYMNSYPRSPYISSEVFPLFGDQLHDYDNFGPGCLLALPWSNRLNFNARTNPRIAIKAFDHPVTIVKDFKNGLGNIVIVSRRTSCKFIVRGGLSNIDISVHILPFPLCRGSVPDQTRRMPQISRKQFA